MKGQSQLQRHGNQSVAMKEAAGKHSVFLLNLEPKKKTLASEKSLCCLAPNFQHVYKGDNLMEYVAVIEYF